MRGAIAAAVFAVQLALAGCATGYGADDITGGYSEAQISPGVWTLRYAGNGYTTRETVQTFWLYRAAELTLEQGYDGFEIVSNMRLSALGGGLSDVQYVEKPYLVGEIRMLKKPFTPRPPTILDAHALKARLEPLVKGKLCDDHNVCPHVHDYLMPPLST